MHWKGFIKRILHQKAGYIQKGFINTKGVKTVMKEFLIVIVLVFHFYAACEFSTHLQRKHFIIALGINILNIKTKHFFEVFKIYLTHIDCTESLPSCSL